METATTAESTSTSQQNTATPHRQSNHRSRDVNQTRNRNYNLHAVASQQRDQSSGQEQVPKQNRNRYQSRINGRPPRYDTSGANHATHESADGTLIAPTDGSNDQSSSREPSSSRGGRRPPKSRGPPGSNDASEISTAVNAETAAQPSTNRTIRGGRRGARFDAKLSEPSEGKDKRPPRKQKAPKNDSTPKQDDLTSNLIRALRIPPYIDCAICFNSIHPLQPTWSCSPSPPSPYDLDIDNQDTADNGSTQCCWATFHLKCVRDWAAKSVKDLEEAWRTRGEERRGEWGCPACRSKREAVPTVYKCFCGFISDPKPPRLSTPHSCASSCSRPRPCGHPCPLQCHPGPCPPCNFVITRTCHCGKDIRSFRCAHNMMHNAGRNDHHDEELICGKTCSKILGCGNHQCTELCHKGDCAPCNIKQEVRCYCGKVERVSGCGEGEGKACSADGRSWVGKFECENICERPFDCGLHKCSKPCHPPSSTPSLCPRSTSLITHCPCGKHPLSKSSAGFFPPSAQLLRTSCSDPIPTCTSNCTKPLAGCDHVCASLCHTGPCPSCDMRVVRPCRCGATTKDIKCTDWQSNGGAGEILCDKKCQALRACGRHQCTRVCCPLASLAGATKGKGKKHAVEAAVLDAANEAGLHECDIVCQKTLSCGNHICEMRDHKGPCPPCFMSSYEELACYCGDTVLEPPIPCGTRIHCTKQCTRQGPPCGHPHTSHFCHQDTSPCPPCPFLTTKRCACGKNEVGNVKCFLERVNCGQTCGKLLACGFHHCDRLCHGDDCGPCNIVCGKPRKLCIPTHHPCALPCHAPASCSEAEPCLSLVTLSCPCGRIRSSVPCGRSTSSPAGREGRDQLICTSECGIAKRNARLAEALGIDPEKRERERAVVYPDHIVAFARVNAKFLGLVERTFADFITSDKKTQVLPHTPPERRKFVVDLSAVYRMDTQFVDQEPYRSVRLIRRIDTRIPSPLLSASLASSMSNLGKLTDLRTSLVARTQTAKPMAKPIPSRAPNPGGWTAVVAGGTAKPEVANAWISSSSSTTSATVDSASWRRPSPVKRPIAPSAAALPPQFSVPPAPVNMEDVPDNWEDDL